MFKYKKQRRGITLVELMVTLALVSIVLVAVVNLFLFNNRVFSRSDALSQVQFDVRMSSDILTKDLRNVSAVSLTDNTLSNQIGVTELQSRYPSVDSVDFAIRSESSKFLVEYTIVGHDPNGTNQYSLKTEVVLNNITSAVSGTGNTIYYDKN